MCKSILLGNGINAHLGISGLDMSSIYKRFINLFNKEKDLFKSLFRDDTDFDGCIARLTTTERIGIESLAKIIYESFNDEGATWTDNDTIRLQDIITCLAVNAIFFQRRRENLM